MDPITVLMSARSLVEDDDDEEELFHQLLFVQRPPGMTKKRRPGGSRPGRSKNKRRDYHSRHLRLLQYMIPFPVYNEHDFRRRFRMHRQLFSRIMTAVVQYDSFFEQKRDAAGRVGISSLLKVTSALRVLAYASSFDSIDETWRFIAVFSPEYLRPPTPSEIRDLLEEKAKHGFVGMVGSIDCMHWTWKNCPMAVAGQHKRKEKKPSKVLEAVADYKLRIWPYNFGSPGSLNDQNILEQSPVFDAILRGEAATVHYEINGHAYNTPYLLADGIYPSRPVFVKSIEKPLGLKYQYFARMQEACRKDVERCLGVLQARWRILDTPCRLWSANDMGTVMKACVILHNMIVVDETDIDPHGYLFDPACQPGGMPVLAVSRPPLFTGLPSVDALVLRTVKLRDKRLHLQLQNDLIEHMWAIHGSQK